MASEVREEGRVSEKGQLDYKRKKAEEERQKKIEQAKKDHEKQITYLKMFHSAACWKTGADATQEFNKLNSITAKENAVKEQILMRTVGLQWKDLHHPFSKEPRQTCYLQSFETSIRRTVE